MNFTQLVTPNLDPVVYQNGWVLTDWLGWCLAVAWTAFGGKTTNPTAWSAWSNSVQHKHPSEQPPSGVYVPIWFSGYGGSGHVAIYKDGTVWSSPYKHKATMDVLSSIAEVERLYGVSYAGWSEDIGSVRVVQPITEEASMPASQEKVDETTIRLEYNTALMRDATHDEVMFWLNAGLTVEGFQRAVLTSDEHAEVYKRWVAGKDSKATVLKPGLYQVN